jgi:hypothetical protein
LNGLEKGFHENIQTRILEKDLFKPSVPVIQGTENTQYYLSGTSMCMNGNEQGCIKTLYENRIR